MALTPLAGLVRRYIDRNGYITAQRAWDHLEQMPSGSLTRRLTELRDAGYVIRRETRSNPVTRRRYSRYFNDGHPKD